MPMFAIRSLPFVPFPIRCILAGGEVPVVAGLRLDFYGSVLKRVLRSSNSNKIKPKAGNSNQAASSR
jgi:hypothetical protein